MNFEIKTPKSQDEWEKYFDLRWRILRKPWNQPKGSEKDEMEEKTIHLMVKENDKAIGCCRIQINSPVEAQLRYMAVEDGFQGKGIGKMMLKEAEIKAREQGVQTMILEARENAVNFYKSNGYRITKESYLLFGSIQHYTMTKNL